MTASIIASVALEALLHLCLLLTWYAVPTGQFKIADTYSRKRPLEPLMHAAVMRKSIAELDADLYCYYFPSMTLLS